MTHPAAVRDAFRRQAAACDRLGSRFTARLCRLAAARLVPAGAPPADAILRWRGDPRADALALRFAGALHAIVLHRRDPGLAAVFPPRRAGDAALWQAVDRALRRHGAFIRTRLALPPQTNETARSGALAPGLLTIAARTGLPLAIWEIGASAGLNLLWSRFGYRFGTARWGEEAGGVRIAPLWHGPPPPLLPVVLAEARGCDAAPIDPRDPEAARRLLSYVWPDQHARLARLRGALALARRHGTRVERADAVDWLAERLAEERPGAARVVLHSIIWQYLGPERQARIRTLIAEAGRRADSGSPLAWLRLEPGGTGPGAAITLTIWPDGQETLLGRADYHGRWVRWSGA